MLYMMIVKVQTGLQARRTIFVGISCAEHVSCSDLIHNGHKDAVATEKSGQLELFDTALPNASYCGYTVCPSKSG